MSYSLSKPRRRPRRTSYCFRTVWWVVEREACWQILCKREGYTMAPYTRRGFAACRRYYVRKLTELMLQYHPERRFV